MQWKYAIECLCYDSAENLIGYESTRWKLATNRLGIRNNRNECLQSVFHPEFTNKNDSRGKFMPFFIIWQHSEIQGSLTYRLYATTAKGKKGLRKVVVERTNLTSILVK